MPIIILAVLVIAAWIHLARLLRRMLRQQRILMSTAQDLSAKLDSATTAIASIKTSVTNIATDVTALKQQIADSTSDEGISKVDADALLEKATALDAATSALASQASAVDDLVPTPAEPPAEPAQ